MTRASDSLRFSWDFWYEGEGVRKLNIDSTRSIEAMCSMIFEKGGVGGNRLKCHISLNTLLYEYMYSGYTASSGHQRIVRIFLLVLSCLWKNKKISCFHFKQKILLQWSSIIFSRYEKYLWACVLSFMDQEGNLLLDVTTWWATIWIFWESLK